MQQFFKIDCTSIFFNLGGHPFTDKFCFQEFSLKTAEISINCFFFCLFFVLLCTASTDLCLEAFFEQLLRINDPHSLLVSATEDKGLVSTGEQKGWQEKGKEKNGGKKIEGGKK